MYAALGRSVALVLALLVTACGSEGPRERVLVGTWAVDPASVPSQAELERKMAAMPKDTPEGMKALLKSMQAMVSSVTKLMQSMEFEFRADGTFQVMMRMAASFAPPRTGRWTAVGDEVRLAHDEAPEGIGSPGAEPPKVLRWKGDALEMPGKDGETPGLLLRRRP
jgi:hypothetical protein